MSIEMIPDSEPINEPLPFAGELPEDANDLLTPAPEQPHVPFDEPIADDDHDFAAKERRVKVIKFSAKLKKTMKQMEAATANVPIAWFDNMAKEHPEWALDDKEKNLLQGSIEMAFEALDIDFAIEPWTYTLSSIWWLLGAPIAVIIFLFVSKKAKLSTTETKEEEK
jgi:hypothetical protein